MESLAGHLLIAPPTEADPDFARAVILLIQHSEEQAVGVILNRLTTRALKEVWKGKKLARPDLLLYSGGPAPEPLMALHAQEDLGDIEVLAGVYYSVQKKQLDMLFQKPGDRLKVFDSHTGWGPGQVEQWIAGRGWGIVPATADQVFHEGDLWLEIARNIWPEHFVQ